jgi:hypothetical protein
MEEDLNRQALHALWNELQRVDWTDLKRYALMVGFWTVVPASILATRKLIDRARRNFIVRQIEAWKSGLSSPLPLLPLDAQLAAVSELRRLEGDPKMVVSYLIGIRVRLEMAGFHESVLGALDKLAEKRLTQTRTGSTVR